MRDENNTPIDMPVEVPPEQPFFDAIHENIDTARNSVASLRKAARAGLALAEAMVEEAVTNARNNDWKELVELRKTTGEEISALTNMVRDRDHEIAELKARITEMEAEVNEAHSIMGKMEEDAELKRQIAAMNGECEINRDFEKELSELSEAHARLVDDNGKLWKDNAELHGINTGLKEARYRLASVIEDLAVIVRNS